MYTTVHCQMAPKVTRRCHMAKVCCNALETPVSIYEAVTDSESQFSFKETIASPQIYQSQSRVLLPFQLALEPNQQLPKSSWLSGHMSVHKGPYDNTRHLVDVTKMAICCHKANSDFSLMLSQG